MTQPHHQPHNEAALEALLAAVKEATQRAEKSIDRTIALCDASNERMAKVDELVRLSQELGMYDEPFFERECAWEAVSTQKVRKTSRVSVDSKLVAEAMKASGIKDKRLLGERALKMLIAAATLPVKRKRVVK